MICHNPGIAVDHLTRPNNLPSRKLRQVPFPEKPIDYINRAMDFLLRQIVTKTHFRILSGTPISLCNRLRIHAGPMPQRRSLLGLSGGSMRSFRCFCRFRIKAKSSSTTAMRQMIMPIGASAARIDNHEISSEIKKPGPSIPGYPGSGFTNLWPRHKILVEAKT